MIPKPHTCPDCQCEWDDDEDSAYRVHAVNRSAPFYPLVALITSMCHIGSGNLHDRHPRSSTRSRPSDPQAAHVTVNA
jgi:hypothetical protein